MSKQGSILRGHKWHYTLGVGTAKEKKLFKAQLNASPSMLEDLKNYVATLKPEPKVKPQPKPVKVVKK